jgi:dGTPase
MVDAVSFGEVELWLESYEDAVRKFPGEEFKTHKHQTVLSIINKQVTDLVDNISKTLEAEGISSPDQVRERGKPIARFSSEMETKNTQLKDFLGKSLYTHHRVLRMADKAERLLRGLFEVYRNEPKVLPPHFFVEIDRVGKERLICDYIAGMTDRYALDEYKKLFDPYEKV